MDAEAVDGHKLGAEHVQRLAINQILIRSKFNFDKSQIGFCKLKLMAIAAECLT